ncbi:MAG: DNRLRE domain-containing protein [Verrucomicrobium sp.]|nr:DNRLRE domain-containing protein [Verrucomicrobium sp.]
MKLLPSPATLLCLAGSLLWSMETPAATILPAQDSDLYAHTGIPTGSTNDLNITSEFAGGPGGPHAMRSFLEFDLSSLGYAPGATVTSAILYLYAPTVTAAGTIRLTNITSDWAVDSSLTWLTQPSVGSTTVDVTVSAGSSWYAFDITSLTQGWVDNPSSNFGVRLNSPASAQVAFTSVDATGGEEAFRPYLVVTPEPGRAALLLIAATSLVWRRRRENAQACAFA